ncbi:hypothetical protein PTKIN_Ptkin09bG0130000 [Pterospermum kingtungense]
MDLRQMVLSQTDVGFSLTKQILQTEAEGSNLVFSPLSIQLILSKIAAGSNGATLDQLLCFLKSKSNDHLSSFSSEIITAILTDGNPVGGPLMSFANGVWIDKSLPFKPSFKQILDTVYMVASNQVDFQNQADKVLSEVNLWAEKKTNGLIKEVLPPESVDKDTRLIFANALYFKGAWNEPFDASKTKDQDFHLINGSSVKVPFMTSREDQIIGVYDGFKVLRLPYKQGEYNRRFSMYIFLPGAKDGLKTLVEKITSESGSLELYLPSRKVKVGEFRIPRFKISFGFEASEVLKGLGLELLFLCGGVTEMVDSAEDQMMYISGIFHQSFIEVNEEGTKAAAVTAVVRRKCCYIPPQDFVADHPFMFLIREDATEVVMFIGHVLNPLES